MTHDEQMSGQADARLDARLGSLPLEVEPGRDLWPGIAARIEASAAPVAAPARRPAWMWQAAAAVILVAGSSLLTASLLDRKAPASQSANQPVAAPSVSGQVPANTAPGPGGHPAPFGPAG